MEIKLSSIVKFEFKGKHLIGRIISIEPTKSAKLITVVWHSYRIGITEKNVIEVLR